MGGFYRSWWRWRGIANRHAMIQAILGYVYHLPRNSNLKVQNGHCLHNELIFKYLESVSLRGLFDDDILRGWGMMYQLHLTSSLCFLSHISCPFNFFLQVSLLSSIFYHHNHISHLSSIVIKTFLPSARRRVHLLQATRSRDCL